MISAAERNLFGGGLNEIHLAAVLRSTFGRGHGASPAAPSSLLTTILAPCIKQAAAASTSSFRCLCLSWVEVRLVAALQLGQEKPQLQRCNSDIELHGTASVRIH